MTTSDKIRVIRRVLNEHVVEDRGYKTPCWIWTGGHNGHGRAYIWVSPTTIGVARALLAAFGELDITNFHEQACHKCNVKNCVRKSHLYPGTQTTNMNDVRIAGTRRGTGNSQSHLTEADIPVIRQRLLTESAPRIARDYGVTPGQIYHIKHGRAWTHIA